MPRDLLKQLNYIYTYTFFAGMMFFFGIEQLFLEQIGDGNFARGVTLAVFSSVLLVLTIPAGAIADIWGRVNSLKLGGFFLLLSLFVLIPSQNVLQYSIGVALFAAYIAFDEGAKEAFVYDLLIDNKLEGSYEKVLGRMYAMFLVGAAGANFVSGYVSDATSLRFTYIASLVPAAVAVYFIFKLCEPIHHRNVGKKMLHQIDDVFREMRVRKLLVLFVIAQGFVWTAGDLVLEFAQPVILEYTSSAKILGLVWGVLGVLMALAYVQVHKLKRVTTAMVLIVVLYVVYLLSRESVISLLPLVMIITGVYAIGVKGENALQVNAPPRLRATAVSVSSSFALILTLLSSLWIGQAEESVSFRVAVLALPMIFIATILYFKGRNSFKKV